MLRRSAGPSVEGFSRIAEHRSYQTGAMRVVNPRSCFRGLTESPRSFTQEPNFATLSLASGARRAVSTKMASTGKQSPEAPLTPFRNEY